MFANLRMLTASVAAHLRPAALPDDSLDALPAESWTVERLAAEAGLPRRAFAAAFKAPKTMPAA